MAVDSAARSRPTKRSVLSWALLTLISVAVCSYLIVRDPQGFRPESIWVSTDYRTGLATTYADKEIKGHYALWAGQWDTEHVRRECPDLAGRVPMTDQDRNSVDVLRIDVDGRRYCMLQGNAIRIDDLEVTLVAFSKSWMTFTYPGEPKPVPFGNAKLKVQRTDQPYVAVAILIVTTLFGIALTKVIEALIGRSRH